MPNEVCEIAADHGLLSMQKRVPPRAQTGGKAIPSKLLLTELSTHIHGGPSAPQKQELVSFSLDTGLKRMF